MNNDLDTALATSLKGQFAPKWKSAVLCIFFFLLAFVAWFNLEPILLSTMKVFEFLLQSSTRMTFWSVIVLMKSNLGYQHSPSVFNSSLWQLTCDYVEFACVRMTLCRLTCDYVEFVQVFHFVAFCIGNGNRQQSGLCIFDWWSNHMAQKTSLPLDTQLLTSNHEYTQVSDSGLSLSGGFTRGGSYHKVTRN